MHRLPVIVLLGIAGIVAAVLSPQPAHAEPLPARVSRPLFYLNDLDQQLPGVGESGAPEHQIYRDIADYLEVFLRNSSAQRFKESPEFACLSTQPGEGYGRVHILPLVFHVAPRDWEIQLSVSVDLDGKGTYLRRVSPRALISGTSYGPEKELKWEGEAIAVKAREQLKKIIDNLITRNHVNLCKAKAKVNGRFRFGGQGFLLERTLTGEGELTLNERGAFELAMTIPDTVVFTSFDPVQCRLTEQGGTCQAGEAMCTVTYQPLPARWTWSGTYRAEDGVLVFTEIRAEGSTTQAMVQCCGPDVCVNYSWGIPGSAGNLPVDDARLVLADGATLSIPPPPGLPGEWEMTLTLEYGGESAEDVAGTPIAGLMP